MQYNKTEWLDRKTVVNAERLNHMEEGIYNAHSEVHEAQTQIETIQANETEFNNQLNEIKNEKGYITTKILKDGTDFNTLVSNGKYRIFQGVNAPKTGDLAFVIDVTVETQSHISQLAGLVKGEERALYHRACIDGVWSSWARVVTNSEVEAIQEEINTIKSDATDLEGRVTTNETEITNIKENIIVVEGDIEAIQGILGSNEGGSSGSLLDRVSKTEEDITALEGRVGVNETDISSLKQQDIATNTKVEALEGRATSSEAEIVGLKEKDIELDGRVVALEGRADTTDTEIGKLKTEDTAIKGRVTALEGKVTMGTDELQGILQGNIDDVKQELQTSIGAVDEKANQNKTQIEAVNTDLQAHKTDTLAHADIRTQIGDVRNLLTVSKEVVGAINEIYERGGSVSRPTAYVSGSERLTRIFAETTTNVFEVHGVKLEKAEIYLMGIRIFNQEDYTVNGSTLTLESTLLQGEYIDILSMDEVIIDLGDNTIVETHNRFTAYQATSTFTIEGSLKYGYLDVYQMGIRLYEDFDYTVNRDTNVVTLVQPLEVGDYVDYTIRVNSGTNITDIQESIKEIPALKTKVDEMSGTLSSSVKGVEASTNYNTIKVIKNDGTIEYVELKILGGGEGSSVKLFESGRVDESYTATTDGETTFTIPTEVTTNSYVEMFFKNLRLINGIDFVLTIDEASGTNSIELGFSLKQGETVYYTVVHTSYDYKDLNNIPDLSVYATASQLGALSEQVNRFPQLSEGLISETINKYVEQGKFSGQFVILDCPDFPLSKGWDCLCVYTAMATTIQLEVYRAYDEKPYINQYQYQQTIDVAKWQQISTLGYQHAPSSITHPKDLPSGKWYFVSDHNPIPKNQFYIEVGLNPFSGYKQLTAYDPFGLNMHIGLVAENEWKGWQQVATTDKIDSAMGYRQPPVGVTSTNDLPNGKWYINSSDNPATNWFYIDCGLNPTTGFGYQRARYPFGEALIYERIQTEGVWKPWTKIATADTISTLWDGNITTGAITLSGVASDCNSIIINYGATTFSSYTLDRTPHKVIDGTYNIALPDGKLTFTITGTSVNISASPTPIRRIIGVKKGGI